MTVKLGAFQKKFRTYRKKGVDLPCSHDSKHRVIGLWRIVKYLVIGL